MNECNSIKSGFVSLIGRPSSGKSTLINALCGFKISIVSPLPQTTRFSVRGIVTEDTYQIIFLDTPGYHYRESHLNKELTNIAVQTLKDGDLVLYLVDLSREYGAEEEELVHLTAPYQDRLLLIFNKEDEWKGQLKENTSFQKITQRFPKAPFLTISALKESNLSSLIELIVSRLPEGPYYYPPEYVTDQSIPFRIEETVREKIFEYTQEEIPHSVYVKTEDLKVGVHRITAHATIYTDRNSQKGIIVGKNGSNIKNIGTAARASLEEIFERKVNLFLNVKVHDNWKKDPQFINQLFHS